MEGPGPSWGKTVSEEKMTTRNTQWGADRKGNVPEIERRGRVGEVRKKENTECQSKISFSVRMECKWEGCHSFKIIFFGGQRLEGVGAFSERPSCESIKNRRRESCFQ